MVSIHCNSSIEHEVTLFINHMQDEMQQIKNILSKIICLYICVEHTENP